jgi:hypothetical protein
VIYYSLGNLVFDQFQRAETQRGALAEVVFSGKTLESAALLPVDIVRTVPRLLTQSAEPGKPAAAATASSAHRDKTAADQQQRVPTGSLPACAALLATLKLLIAVIPPLLSGEIEIVHGLVGEPVLINPMKPDVWPSGQSFAHKCCGTFTSSEIARYVAGS